MTVLAVDVGYAAGGARAAGIAIDDWEAATPAQTWTCVISEVAPYVSGAFYQRELPCILRLLTDCGLKPAMIIVDGYVTLDGGSKPGLGLHLFNALTGTTPIIGVAKTAYAGIPPEHEIRRGRSARPLYITCKGLDLDTAKQLVLGMHGRHRIPTLLKAVDQLSRVAIT